MDFSGNYGIKQINRFIVGSRGQVRWNQPLNQALNQRNVSLRSYAHGSMVMTTLCKGC
jgi:hypothetical protein